MKHLLEATLGSSFMYRLTLVVEYLGWVDLDLGSFPGWWATFESFITT